MSAYLIKGGRVVDPATGGDEVADVLIEGGVIADVGKGLEERRGQGGGGRGPRREASEAPWRRGSPGGGEIIDAHGLVVAPGLVDLHAHLREPGREDEETIATASEAAAAGGYTAICAMPNTDPVADNAAIVEKVWALGRESGLVEVVPAGALSKGLAGRHMADYGEMVRSAARTRLFTDDGKGVQNALFARRAMEYLAALDAVYAEHCEEDALSAGGQMNEGELSVALGLRGVPAEAEELIAARDIALARRTGCRLHLLHVSTAGTVELLRRAKVDDVPVTAEVTPHHFTLTEDALASYDPMAKVNPPLRTDSDRRAVIDGLADGTIDAIATDHAPHAVEEKDQEFSYAPPGMIGLETALALAVTELVEPGHLTLGRALECLSTAPARILGLDAHGGPLAPGRPAHVVVFDPAATWTVDTRELHSKSRNTAFAGRTLSGRVVHTFFGGRRTVASGRVAAEVPA